MLLQKKEGAHLEKRRERVLAGDVRDDGVVLAVEAAEEMEDLPWVSYRLAQITELVGEGLELGAELHHRHVALDDGVVLSVDVHRAGHLVVAEELVDGEPHGAGRVLGLHDRIEELRRDGGIQPVDDGVVGHLPLGVGGAWNRLGVDVRT